MKLQGVIILRITDLIRFFDLAEFWQFRQDFAKLFMSDEYGCFFDAMEQKYLANEVSEWLQDREPRVMVNDEQLVINVEGEDHKLPLGRLSVPVRDCRSKHALTEKQIKGLTALYMMLGADKLDSDIPIQFDFFSSMRSGSGETRPLFADCVLSMSSLPVPSSYTRTLIVNMNSVQSAKQVHVQLGKNRFDLKPMECLTGLFDENNDCVRILPRSIRDFDGHTCSLVYDPISKQPRLKVEKAGGVESFDNVYCFNIEKGGDLVYLTQDGKLHYSEDKCFRLHNSYTTFRRYRPDAVLMAFEISSSGNYVFYTDQGIIR